MSEDLIETEMADETPAADEKSILLSRAKLMGIKVSNNASVETLRAKIAAKQGEEEAEPAEAVAPLVAPGTAPLVVEKVLTLREQLYQDNMKLVRLRITNLDPKKKDLPGEIFTVANKFLGTVRKFIPYGEVTENGWHVPYIIYQQMKERKFQNIRVTTRNDRPHVETTLVPEFALEVLPNLTEAEHKKLAAAQQAEGGMS